tara:strand:- start:524 stop:850 length:327 start_codon:yes stop_codon:yes gene_type:complete
MSAPKPNDTAAEHYESTDAHHVSSNIDEKLASGNVVQIQAASVALAAAVAAQKPSLWSKSMLQLYFIMGIGYLVSTMNGFGKSILIAFNMLHHTNNFQIPPSWAVSTP